MRLGASPPGLHVCVQCVCVCVCDGDVCVPVTCVAAVCVAVTCVWLMRRVCMPL